VAAGGAADERDALGIGAVFPGMFVDPGERRGTSSSCAGNVNCGAFR
jgi:hypothetical protein